MTINFIRNYDLSKIQTKENRLLEHICYIVQYILYRLSMFVRLSDIINAEY